MTHLSERETIDFLCYDLAPPRKAQDPAQGNEDLENADYDGVLEDASHERAPLMDTPAFGLDESFYDEHVQRDSICAEESDFASIFANLNALEIAAVANAKAFLSQKSMQQIIMRIWTGDIVFWETLSKRSVKRAKVYRKSQSDPFCRLRVPLYLKAFEVFFFAAFLAFYYIVLVEKHTSAITVPEILLYVWLAAFSYNGAYRWLPVDAIANGLQSLWSSGTLVRRSMRQTSGHCGTLESSSWELLSSAPALLDWCAKTMLLPTLHSTYYLSKLCFWCQGGSTSSPN